jgi:hypothetical protein
LGLLAPAGPALLAIFAIAIAIAIALSQSQSDFPAFPAPTALGSPFTPRVGDSWRIPLQAFDTDGDSGMRGRGAWLAAPGGARSSRALVAGGRFVRRGGLRCKLGTHACAVRDGIRRRRPARTETRESPRNRARQHGKHAGFVARQVVAFRARCGEWPRFIAAAFAHASKSSSANPSRFPFNVIWCVAVHEPDGL